MSGTLTPEQKRKIEENRKLALEKRASRLAANSTSAPTGNSTVNPSNTQQFFNQFAKTSSSNSFNKPPSGSARFNSQGNSSKAFFQKKASSLPNSTVKSWVLSDGPITGHVYLISKDRFAVDVPYDTKVIDFFKTIPGKNYDASTRKWSFPLDQYTFFKEKSASLKPMCVFSSLPSAALQVMHSKPVDLSKIDLSTIEPTLISSLFPFQAEGVRFGISKSGKCLIADDMGLGKTLQALAIADYYRDDWPLLIICPSSMKFQWEEEIVKRLPSIPSYRIFVINSSKDDLEKASVIIVSYDLLGKVKDKVKSHGFGVIIMDESHSLKSAKTQRTKVALDMAPCARRCILLSGTPALSRPIELFTQIKVVAPKLFKDMIEFGIRYCDGKQDNFGWNFTGSSNLQELKVIMEDKVMIRRLKSDVLDQLPSKMRTVVILNSELVDTKSKLLNVYAKKLNSDALKGSEKHNTLLSYFSETGRAKIRAVCEHVENLLEQNQKFLLFAHHRDVLDAVCELLESHKVFYIRIDGSVNSEERKSVCDQFQQEDKFRVAVLSIKAANMGVTLTAAQLVVFAELFWNPGELTQAEDRAHRIGQKDSVMVQYLIAKQTADDYIWPLVQSKLSVLNRAGLSENDQLKTIDTSNQVSTSQSSITDFFSHMDSDEELDADNLNSLLDEIEEAIPTKKPRQE